MSQPTLPYQRNLEIRHEVDILVVGGGPAGITAALAAARQGRTVRLIEAHTSLGGMGTSGLVPAFAPFTDGVNMLADGIGREVLDALRAAGGTLPGPDVSIRVEVLKRVYDRLLSDAGIPFTFHTRLVDATRTGGRVLEAVCAGSRDLFAIRAHTFVDATGDGTLAALAGAPFQQGDNQGHVMPGTLCSLWTGIDWNRVNASRFGTGNARIEDAFRDGVFSLEDRHLPGMWRVGATVGGGNIGHTFDLDGTDEESLTRAYLWARRSLPEYERYYKEYLEGFEAMELVATAPLMGVRETRRITGDYVLGLEDFERRAVFPDEIGRYSYPVDIHIAQPDRESYEAFYRAFKGQRLGKGESYGIPYRILTPLGLDNVWVSGRCVSTDRSMQSSIRVMPGCFITGQAAGVAAALAVESGKNSRGIDVGMLQRRLKALGAWLPN